MAENKSTPETVTVTKADLASLIQAEVAKATAAATTGETNGLLANLIGSIKGMTPPRKVGLNERVPRTAFDPKGTRKEGALKRACYQNGHRVREDMLFETEVDLWNRLVPGRFVHKLVRVRVKEGTNGAMDEVHLEYANSTVDQRNALSHSVRSAQHMLQMCVDGVE